MKKVLLLPPGSFNKSFFEPYLTKYAKIFSGYDIHSVDLPSRNNPDDKPIEKDAIFIANLVNKDPSTKIIVIGISTSVASLLYSLKYLQKDVQLVLVFGGEFIGKYRRVWARILIKAINASKATRNLFFKYLKRKYFSYRKDRELNIQNLLLFYEHCLNFQLPFQEYNYKTLIYHARYDNLVDKNSRKKLESMFPNRFVRTINCTHEPKAAVADTVINALSQDKSVFDYLHK